MEGGEKVRLCVLGALAQFLASPRQRSSWASAVHASLYRLLHTLEGKVRIRIYAFCLVSSVRSELYLLTYHTYLSHRKRRQFLHIRVQVSDLRALDRLGLDRGGRGSRGGWCLGGGREGENDERDMFSDLGALDRLGFGRGGRGSRRGGCLGWEGGGKRE